MEGIKKMDIYTVQGMDLNGTTVFTQNTSDDRILAACHADIMAAMAGPQWEWLARGYVSGDIAGHGRRAYMADLNAVEKFNIIKKN
tara:strand:+ start:133 stop:390 length:258 start_codon:yes stop_codon:yes gene_type:complete